MQKISQRMCTHLGLLFLGIFVCVAFVSPIHAQGLPKIDEQFQSDQTPLPPSHLEVINANTAGAVSCSDYYTPDSVQVDVAPYFTTLYPTDALQFNCAENV